MERNFKFEQNVWIPNNNPWIGTGYQSQKGPKNVDGGSTQTRNLASSRTASLVKRLTETLFTPIADFDSNKWTKCKLQRFWFLA